MKRKTIDIDETTEKAIQDMADAKKWSFSYMSYVLLQYALKEKQRKKKGSS
jgi:hypothetical protein